MLEKDNQVLISENWDFEADQNWEGFWNLLLQEDMRQNPDLYKQPNKND